MRRTCAYSALLPVLALCSLSALASPPGLRAQTDTTAKRPLTLDDYATWNRIQRVTLSPDGRWLAYAHVPNDGDATLFVKELEGKTVHQATNGQRAVFSDDGRWVAFLTTPPEAEAKKLRKQKKPVPKTLHVLDLRSGDETTERGVRSFAFSKDGAYLAALMKRSDPKAEHQGADLLLRNLATGVVTNLGNVEAYAFDPKEGSSLAYLVDAAGRAGNGVYLLEPSAGRVTPLRTGAHAYDDLVWNEEGTALAALAGDVPEGKARRANRLLIFREVTGREPHVTVYDPADDGDFPEGFVLSELARTRWTRDGARILVGIKEQEDEAEEKKKDDEETVDVDVWHWKDERLQSQQMIQAAADRRYTYASVYNVDSGRFVRLADDDVRRVDVDGHSPWGVGRDDAPYRMDRSHPGGRADYVRIDLETGRQAPIARGVRRPLGTSPHGRWFVYLKDEHVHAVKLETLGDVDLTAATGIDFVNREFDLPDEPPAWGLGGWTEGGAALLYTRYDVWEVPLNGGAPARAVSGGMGARDSIDFRVVRLDPDSDWVDPDHLLLSAYGEWTKKSGYFRARPGKNPQALLFDDEMVRGVRKAKDADRVVFTRQTFERFPDYWTSDTRFRHPRRVTDANPQIADYLWGRRVLVDYTDARGHKLQATLTLPAGYERGKRYPMLVYFYEKMSQRHHQFSMPVYDDRPHMSTYASNGYLVLMPDIVYDIGRPGSSALDDVTSATRKVIELGYADPDHIGIQGHSWGGYETSFILTQTDMFAAVVTGAPLTDLVSMYNINYKRTGFGNGPLLEWSQGRLGTNPWKDLDLIRSQSPLEHADHITTPFLILQGTADGAVDWNQGLELYNAARRLGKKVILLSYPGEPHHLRRKANQKDFQIRMKQFFDHYLKGTPAPKWMTDGVPFLRKRKEGQEAGVKETGMR